MTTLDIRDLQKSYADLEAVRGVSFVVEGGTIVGLLGPNGAGKTTIINMILGVLEPTTGAITLEGEKLSEARSEVIGKTNFVAVYAQLPGNLTVAQNLRVFGHLYGVLDVEKRIEEVLAEFELVRFKDTKCGLLSSGEQTRVSLAKAILNRPRLLLLDEPTASLDPATARVVRKKIRGYAADGAGAVLWTSHNMYEVEEVCDRVLFLSHGRILLEGDPKTLPRERGKKNLEDLFIAVAHEPLSFEV